MSDSEENKNPPTKISSIDSTMSELLVETGLNAIKDNFAPVTSEFDDHHETMSEAASDATAEDATDPLDDTAEVYNSHLERYTDQLVKSCKEKGKPSQGIPEIMFCIQCIHPVPGRQLVHLEGQAQDAEEHHPPLCRTCHQAQLPNLSLFGIAGA